MADAMTSQNPAHLSARNVDRITSSHQAIIQCRKDASAARLRQGGSYNRFLHICGWFFLGRHCQD